MRGFWGRITVAAVCLLLVMPLVAVRAQVGDDKGIEHSDRVRPYGWGYCFQRSLFFGGIIITGGRCYNFYLVHTAGGVFLGFGPQGQLLVPPGEVVRLGTPAGHKLKGKLFYLIPMAGYVAPIPVESIQFLQVQAGLRGNRIVVLVPKRNGRPHEVSFQER